MGSAVERVLAAVDESEVIGFLQELARVPTVNPPGDVRIAAERCGAVLGDAGFVVRYAQLEPEKPNLIATLGQERGPTLCFNAHLDVVPPGERGAWTVDPFAGVVRDGRVVGRGVLDDKASVAAQVMAGVALARSGVALFGRLVVNEVADEESGGPAGAALIVGQREVVPDFVIVGEPTQNRVCLGERGGGLVKIEVLGRAAHGALPWEGANAVEAAALAVAALRAELWPVLETRTHPFFHHSSASVNVVAGGVSDNVVPDRCQVSIDRRFVPGEEPDACLAEVREVVERAVAAVPGCTVDVRYDGEVNRARVNAPDSPVAAAMLAANRFLGGNTEPTGFSMATDGRFFAAAGYPTVIYGPGDPKVAHIPDEWVAVEDVLHATRAYALAAWNVLGS